MRIDIIAAVPMLLESLLGYSIVKRAKEAGKVEIKLHDLRDYTPYKHKQIDDYPFGGGAGMVLMPEPIANCLDTLQAERKYDEVIFLTPDGTLLNQPLCNSLSTVEHLILLCGHYKGIDHRIRDLYITKEISIGDYVLTGGEIAAAVLTDSIVRLIPGVLHDETSALSDSFQDGLLSPPVYTRPREFKGIMVPEVLLSGNEKMIDAWRHEQSLARTQQRRPGLLSEE